MSVAEQDHELPSRQAIAGVGDTDGALLGRVAAGDRDAFDALYDSLAPSVHGVAVRVLRDAVRAEEATQDVFLTIWRTAPRFDPSRGSARTWVLTLAHRRAVELVRREQSPAATRSASEPVGKALGSLTPLTPLTPLQRNTIALAYFEGLTCVQVAERLGIPLSTARTRIRDGLRRMAAELPLSAAATK